jgi:hypothetical protein
MKNVWDPVCTYFDMKTALLAALLLTLSGCNLFRSTPPPPEPQSKPGEKRPLAAATLATDTATSTADAAAVTAAKKDADRDAKLKANVVTARTENQKNPEGFPKTIVEGELSTAESRLADVKTDPVELAAAAQRRALVESGRAEEARQAYSKASDEAKKNAQELTKAQEELRLATLARDKARADEKAAIDSYTAQMEANRVAAAATQAALISKHSQELDKERRRFFNYIGYALIAAAIVCILIGAFSVYTKIQTGDVLKAVVIGAVWAGAGGVLIAFAWTINQPWFKWVVVGGGVLAAAGLVIYLITEYNDAQAKKTRLVEANEAEDTLSRVMTVLDTALPENSDVFGKLSSLLNDSNKALIHELRAEAKRFTPTKTV